MNINQNIVKTQYACYSPTCVLLCIVYILSSCIFKSIQSSLYAYIIYIRLIKLGDSTKIHIRSKHR